MWHRFVNVKGGEGKTIPSDLFNEHVNNQLKVIIANMRPNLTEAALQRAALSVSTLHAICERFDQTTALPHRSTAYSTRSDIEHVKMVTDAVLECNLLKPTAGRYHPCFPEEVEHREDDHMDQGQAKTVPEVQGWLSWRREPEQLRGF